MYNVVIEIFKIPDIFGLKNLRFIKVIVRVYVFMGNTIYISYRCSY